MAAIMLMIIEDGSNIQRETYMIYDGYEYTITNKDNNNFMKSLQYMSFGDISHLVQVPLLISTQAASTSFNYY